MLLLLWLLAVAALSAVEVSSRSGILEKPYSLIYFYAPDCKYCEAFSPQYDYLAQLYSDNDNFHAVKVNGRVHKDLVLLFGVTVYPTLKLYDDVNKKVVTFNGARSPELLDKFIGEHTDATANISAVPQHVEEVSDVAHVLAPQLVAFVSRLSDWRAYYYPSHFYQQLAREHPEIKFSVVFTNENGSELMAKYHVSNTPLLVYVASDGIGIYNTLSTNHMVNYRLDEDKVRLFLDRAGVGEWFNSETELAAHAEKLEFEGHKQRKGGMNVVESRPGAVADVDAQYEMLMAQIAL